MKKDKGFKFHCCTEPLGRSCGKSCTVHHAAVRSPGDGRVLVTLTRNHAHAHRVLCSPPHLSSNCPGTCKRIQMVDVPTLLKLLAVKDKMIDALLREKTQASSSSSSKSSPPLPPSTLHTATQTPPPPLTATSAAQCDPLPSSPNATDVPSLFHSVNPALPPTS